jgi:hypothetical protein
MIVSRGTSYIVGTIVGKSLESDESDGYQMTYGFYTYCDCLAGSATGLVLQSVQTCSISSIENSDPPIVPPADKYISIFTEDDLSSESRTDNTSRR